MTITITRKEIAKILATMVDRDIEQIELDCAIDWRGTCVDSIDFDVWKDKEYLYTILTIEGE